jgi:hypothetical protein
MKGISRCQRIRWSPGAAGCHLEKNAMTPQTLESFQKTRPWVLFLSILGMIAAGFMFLVALFIPLGIMFSNKAGSAPGVVPAAIGMCLAYLAMAVFSYLLPSVLLCRYAMRIRDLLAAPNDTATLEKAIGAQKSFWRYVGILSLVMICLVVVAFVIAMVTGIVAAGRHPM